MNSPKIFVLTGPESTGKTTLATVLSEQLRATLVPEYARIFLEKNGSDYDFKDFEQMLFGQIASEEQALSSPTDIVIFDTDVLTYKIWSMHKYGAVSTLILEQLNFYQNRFYLLCKPDIDWEEDELRENPNEAWELFEQYELALKEHGLAYEIISGRGDERMEFARVTLETNKDLMRSTKHS